MASPIRLLIILTLLLVGCTTGPGVVASGGDTKDNGSWSYAKGPHGENCLFYAGGTGQGQYVAMSCDSVNP
jgi:hypothetical protein